MGVDFETEMTYAQAFYDVVSSSQKQLFIACMCVAAFVVCHTICFGAFTQRLPDLFRYMTLSNNASSIGGGPGQKVYDAIIAASERGVDVRIAKVR